MSWFCEVCIRLLLPTGVEGLPFTPVIGVQTMSPPTPLLKLSKRFGAAEADLDPTTTPPASAAMTARPLHLPLHCIIVLLWTDLPSRKRPPARHARIRRGRSKSF